MNYSDKLKVVWITPMRTATRTTSRFHQFFNFDRTGQHKGNIPKEKNEYTLILNIRSPYPRLVSLYHLYLFNNPNLNPIFDKWVEIVTKKDLTILSEYDVFLDKIVESLVKIPDYYVRTEFLESDLKKIPFIKNDLNKLSSLFKNYVIRNEFENEFSPRKHWTEYYNQELADLVYSRTEEQFKLFNYNKDYWKDGTP